MAAAQVEMKKEEQKKIVVVAVDESEESMYALSWFLENFLFSNTQDNTLVLVYSKPPPPVFSPLDGTGYVFSGNVIAAMEKYGRDLADSVMKKAENLCRNYSEVVKLEKKVGNGDPRSVICEAVEKAGADLLVMGSHGYGFFKRTLLGSVSDYCSKNAKCPVLIVKRPKHLNAV